MLIFPSPPPPRPPTPSLPALGGPIFPEHVTSSSTTTPKIITANEELRSRADEEWNSSSVFLKRLLKSWRAPFDPCVEICD